MHTADLRATVAAALDLPPDDLAPDDDLIAHGLDSITMMRLAGTWRAEGRAVSFADLLATPTLAAWTDLLATAATPAPKLSTVDESAPFPLALMQHAYWVGRQPGQRLGGVAAHFYNEFDGGRVDPDRLDHAVRALIARHPMLRVQILDDGTQRVLDPGPWPGLHVEDLRDHPDPAARLDELRRTLSHRTLDITAGEVFDIRLTLLPTGARVHVNLDMIAADALSLRVLLADLATLYAGATLPALDYSYPRYLADRDHAQHDPADRAYWLDRLPDLPGAPQLPAAHHGDIDATTVVRRHRLLPAAEVDRFATNARAHGLTPAMALAAVFAETLTAWSAEPRFLLNLPLFDREPLHPDVAGVVGDFTSSVLLAWDGTTPGTFADRARALQRRFHADAAHASFSGVDVLRELSRAEGAQVLAPVVYTSALGLGPLFPESVRECFGEPVWIISQGPQVWLDAQVTELDGGLLINWDAREAAFAPGVLDAMFAAYSALIDALADPAAFTAPVPDLLPTTQAEVRTRVNDTDAPTPATTLHQGFFANADSPAPALLWADGALSYRDTADRALRVAGHLRAQGVGRGDLVAVSLPKGPDQVIAVLGVLAAGAAYLPLGVDHPPARRERILAAAGVRHVLDHLPDGPPLPAPDLSDGLAYVIYTSGSTGEPKGVEVTHAAAMNTIHDLNTRFAIGPDDRTLAMSALDFDLSVYDIFGPLSAGGAVICPTGRRDAAEWADLAARHRATIVNCVPALLDMLLTELGECAIRLALLGGDRVTTDLPGRLAAAAPGARFVGLGGTTETAIHSTVCEVVGEPPAEWTCVPYGTPLDNVRCRVVDDLGRDRPDWVPGELWIGGAGVAAGYRGDPDRTADRFVERDGLRWYRTGDRARYLPDGSLEFLGRLDGQVKVRGHRVELGEVEAALTAHPAVTAAAAVLTDAGRVAAAVVIDGDHDLAAFLADRLPQAMIPDVTAVDALPLTANGKIDRKALRRALAVRPERAATPPATDVERRVAAAWADVLDVAEVGREHDFFALGGDSLLATRLIARLRADGLDGVTLTHLFTHPTLAGFAATLTTGARPTTTALVTDPDHRHEPFPPTDVQRAYWLGRDPEFTLGGVGCHFYREYDFADLDLDRLEAAATTLIARHDMLRAIFDDRGDQRVLPEVPAFRITRADSAAELRDSTAHRVYDPASWPLFTIAAAPHDGGTRLAVGMDNLVLDALSIITFYNELEALYLGHDLPPVDLTFRDYQLSRPAEPTPADQAYWRDRLDTLPPAPRLPLAVAPAEVKDQRFHRRTTVLDADTWRAVTDRAREHGVTPSAVLLAAFAHVLGRWSDRADLTVTLTLFDREDVHPDVGAVLGDFTSLLLIASTPAPTWLDQVRGVQADLWRALDHRSASAVWVLRELARRTGAAEAAVPVVFTSALGVADQRPGMFAEPVWGITQTPQVWLDHQVVERPGGRVELNWDSVDQLFPDGVLDAMFDAYLGLVGRLARGDWHGPAPLPLPDAQARTRALVNDTAAPTAATLLHAGFFAHARATPDAIAVLPDRLTYGELADRALRVAGSLVARGVGPGDLVGVTIAKGADQIAAVLGVLAAGAAYVPVGVDQPAARRDRVLASAGVKAVLTEAPTDHAPLPGPLPVTGDALAYVIFTSGSTGDPKGVEMTHAAAVNTVEDINDRHGVGPADRVLAVSALDFDLSVYDLFGLLGAGGAVVTVAEDERRDARRWARLVAEHRVTVWNTVPTLLDMLLLVAEGAAPEPLDSLRLALLSGDWVGLDLPGRLAAQAPACAFVALGGATEAAIWSNAYPVDRVDPAWRSIPYGFPLRNQTYRVVDALGRDCPDWVPGELWIGGAGVARGYRGAPELTAAKFTGGWYRTGDLGRYRPDGALEFLGRLDHQVKLRGHRIEPGEIEAALLAHPAVTAAVAVVAGEPRRLVAAVVGEVDPADAVAFAATRLPAAMVPDVLVLPALPLTANGKLDRAAVAALAQARSAAAAEPPASCLEERLAELWADLLGRARPGRDESFFAVGGDSVAAIRFVERVAADFGVTVPLARFFAQPTLRRTAELVDDLRAAVEEGVI